MTIAVMDRLRIDMQLPVRMTPRVITPTKEGRALETGHRGRLRVGRARRAGRPTTPDVRRAPGRTPGPPRTLPGSAPASGRRRAARRRRSGPDRGGRAAGRR